MTNKTKAQIAVASQKYLNPPRYYIMDTPVRILFLDVETAPNLGWVWGKWQQNVIQFEKNWHLLSFAYKWANEKEVHFHGLNEYPGYAEDKENDELLMRDLWDILNEADIVIAHNGKTFDLPKINTRFITHGMKPTSPYKIVDTLLIARKVFAFDSNKLDDLARYLGFGKKLPHEGFHLWHGCMTGDPASWEKMKQYNMHDVSLLEELYYLIRAWDQKPPQVNKGETVVHACPRCSSHRIQKRGFSYTAKGKKQRFQCLNCSGWYEDSAKVIK